MGTNLLKSPPGGNSLKYHTVLRNEDPLASFFIAFARAMLRAALFVLLLSCASALQLPSHGRPRLVPLSSSSSGGGGGGLSVRSGPITCKTTDEDWARRWPNATPEELANMKKWCAAGPTRRKGSGVIHKLHRSAAPLHRCTAAPLHRVLP